MSTPAVLARPDVTFRWMIQRDLAQILEIENQSSRPRWTAQDFRDAFEALDTVARVAEIGDQIVGFVVYRITQEPDIIDMESVNHYVRGRTRGTKPAQMEILNLVVPPDYQRQGIGRALLQVVERRLQQSGGCVQMVVPETCLACQLLLRSSGYRATRLLRNHFEEEDGYVMERRE